MSLFTQLLKVLGSIHDLQFSPDDRWVAVIDARQLQLWEVTNPDNIVKLKGYDVANDYSVSSMVFSDDSSMLVASTSYGVEFWDTNTQELIHTLPRSDFSRFL